MVVQRPGNAAGRAACRQEKDVQKAAGGAAALQPGPDWLTARAEPPKCQGAEVPP